MSCLAVKSAECPIDIGVEIFWSNPTGTLRKDFTSDVGNGGAFFISKDLGGGHALRYMSSLTMYPDKTLSGNSGNLNSHLLAVGASFDYTYHLRKVLVGPYFLGGIGVRTFLGQANSNSLPPPVPISEIGGNSIPAYTRYEWDSGPKLALQLGGGYDFNRHWGATIRYQWNRSLGYNLGTFEGGVNYRF
jgi:opacity protein-like surface antigen